MKNKSSFNKFLLLWVGELISAIGGGLTSFGLGVYVFNQTGSAGSMALVTLFAFVPTLLLSAPAGVLADRYDRRLLMMLGDGCSAIGIVFILVCMFTGNASLLEICIGVGVSSVFSSLLTPSYRATVTDLLSKEEYSKASGMVGIADSTRYLVSPILAGVLLAVADIKLLLIIDVCTFFITVSTTAVVRKGLKMKKNSSNEGFMEAFKIGWKAIIEKRGIIVLILVSSLISCFMGVLQILSEPLILDFASSTTLGIAETICATGMLFSSVFLGIRGIKKKYVGTLSLSLILAGTGMVIFGLKENIYIICLSGFLFFLMLPFANNCLDYLVRINIEAKLQGRAWGLIALISQSGYVVAYASAGFIADGIADFFDIGVGRGAAVVIMGAGVLLVVTALMILPVKSVRLLEKGVSNEEKTCTE